MPKKGAAAIVAFGLSSLVAANACNNNCGRQVIGTAGGPGVLPQATRKDLCSSFLATTTTVTPPTVTQTPAVNFQRRNVHNRAVTTSAAPTVTGTQPAYASFCSDNVAYWSACQCFGIAPTTITVTAPTPTTTLPGTTCTEGAEYALWVFPQGSSQAQDINAAYYDFNTLNRDQILSGATPQQNGLTYVFNVNEQGDYPWNMPLVYDNGLTGPDGSSLQYNILEHRGYLIPSTSGAYTFDFNMVDDVAAVWIGSHAVSGIDISQTVLNGTLGTYNPPLQYSLNIGTSDVGVPVPFRIFWGNSGGPGGIIGSINAPDGTQLLGASSAKNSQIVASCSGPGVNAPEWPTWGTEN